MRLRALGLVLLLLTTACSNGGRDVALRRAPDATTTTSAPAPTSAPPVTPLEPPSSVAPPPTEAPTTTAPPPPATVPPAALGAAVALGAGRQHPWTTGPYRGFGAWLDTYDWSVEFSRSGDVAGPEAVDHMAAEGVQTLYIQASRWNSSTDVLEPERLQTIIDRAHQRGIAVVAWYLPTLEDPATDLRRILAVAALDVDGVAIDIEARNVGDVAERNRRLIDLSAQLRVSLPGKAIGGIVLEPVLLEDVNPNYWPSFPWAEIAPFYDVWLPMGYWTNRKGHWRSAYEYTAVNMARVRERIGQPEALLHPIGGIGDKTTVDDLREMVSAATEQRAIGGSIYDYRTSKAEFWETLRSFRASG